MSDVRGVGRHSQVALCKRLLEVIEQDVLPMTRVGVAEGNKAFGAAILRKADLSVVVTRTNRETHNPLFHGEISTLNAFYALAPGERPVTSDCIFVSSHESCPLCLSAITWAGFDNFYYLFDYRTTRDTFQIPHNLQILQEVFKIPDGNYARANAFWQCHDITGMCAASGAEASRLNRRIEKIKSNFVELSEAYQRSKSANEIPLK